MVLLFLPAIAPLHNNFDTKALITSRFNDNILCQHFLVPVEHKHHNHATFMNQKVVTQNFIIEVLYHDFRNTLVPFCFPYACLAVADNAMLQTSPQ
jgi:hypothetical protein